VHRYANELPIINPLVFRRKAYLLRFETRPNSTRRRAAWSSLPAARREFNGSTNSISITYKLLLRAVSSATRPNIALDAIIRQAVLPLLAIVLSASGDEGVYRKNCWGVLGLPEEHAWEGRYWTRLSLREALGTTPRSTSS
jgi:hypothetical protein